MLHQNPSCRARTKATIYWSAFLLFLGASVVLWGTAYKLSLYHPDEQRGDMPAKLCTRLSDTAQDNVQQASMLPAHSSDINVEPVEIQPDVRQTTWLPAQKKTAPPPLPIVLRPQSTLRPPPSSLRADV